MDIIKDYKLIAKGYEFGPAIYKVIIKLNEKISKSKKYSIRVLTNGKRRKILSCYPSDFYGIKQEFDANCLTLLLDVKYCNNDLLEFREKDYKQSIVKSYLVKIKINIEYETNKKMSNSEIINNDSIDKVEFEDLEKFDIDSIEFNKIKLNKALFIPIKDNNNIKLPLIIWLHGLGEGGDDIRVPLYGNKVTSLISPTIQSKFNTNGIEGACVLVIQSPTMWMDNGKNEMNKSGSLENGQQSMYTELLFNTIDDIVKNNPIIDKNRIYLGGCSNGGYMTMNLLFNYPNYFAAFFPICEAYLDSNISDDKINLIKDKNIYFVQSEDDLTVKPQLNVLKTYERLIAEGANNIYLSYSKNVNGDDIRKRYYGHFVWIKVFNNCIDKVLDVTKYDNSKEPFIKYIKPENCTKKLNLFEWLNSKKFPNS